MGLEINQVEFEPSDYDKFSAKLNGNLNALKQLLQTPGFGDLSKGRSIGSEVELYLIDPKAKPAQYNTQS